MNELPERIFNKIHFEPNTGCWLWMAGLQTGGYGHTTVQSRGRVAHRVIYETLVGPIPAGLTLDHLCRVRRCVNPSHLEPVSHRINILRGVGTGARYARRTHCIHGHPLDGTNAALGRRGWRRCRTCSRLNKRLYKQRLRARTGVTT